MIIWPQHIWIDTTILVHDYMHRNPAVAQVRNVVPQQAEALARYRAMVHDTLITLAQRQTQVHTTSTVLWRLAALLGEWYIPPAHIRTEVQYLLSNYHLHDQTTQMLHEAIDQLGPETQKGLQEAGWQLLGNRLNIRSLLTCAPADLEDWPQWQVLKPEDLQTAKH